MTGFNHQSCASIDYSDHVQQPRDSSFSWRVCNIKFIASQSLGSCRTQHVPNKYLHGMQMFRLCWLTICLQLFHFFFYSQCPHTIQDWMFQTHMHVLFFPPTVQTSTSAPAETWLLKPQGASAWADFISQTTAAMLPAKRGGAHRLTHYCGHLVK